MRKCSPIIMTHDRRCSAVHSAVAAPVYKHHGRLLAFVTAGSWQRLPPVCPERESEREIDREKGRGHWVALQGSLGRKRLTIDPQEFTLEMWATHCSRVCIIAALSTRSGANWPPKLCASRITIKLFWWDLEFPHIFAARNQIGDRYSWLAISLPLPSSPHLHVRNVSFFPLPVVCQRALCVVKRSLHLFSRCGDGSCWKSLAAAFTRDPWGRVLKYCGCSNCLSLCRPVFVDFHLPTSRPRRA